jgi:hypothetical protein
LRFFGDFDFVSRPIPQRARTCIFRLVLARSRSPCSGESQAIYFLAHLALLVPPDALSSPSTPPKFSKGALRDTAGARHFLGSSSRRPAPTQQSSRRIPLHPVAPRSTPQQARGKIRLAKPHHERVASQSKPQRVPVFSEATTAAILAHSGAVAPRSTGYVRP